MDLYFRGLKRDDVAREVDVSTGKVSNILRKFRDEAEMSSIEEAAKTYGIAEQLGSLRDLSINLMRSGISVKEAQEGYRLLVLINKLTNLGVEAKDFPKFLELLKRMADQDLPIEEFVKAAKSLLEMEKKTGRGFQQVLSEYKARLRELRKVEGRIRDLETKRGKLDIELKDELKRHKMTLERIDRISKLEEALREHGLYFWKLEQLANVIKSIEELGYNPDTIIAHGEKIDSLVRMISTLEKRKEDLMKELGSYERKLSDLPDRLKTLEEEKDTLESELPKMRMEYDTLTVDLNRKRSERERLTRECDELYSKLSKLTQEMKELEKKWIG